MKRIFLSLTGLLLLGYAQNSALAATPATSAPEDTIVITMPDKSKMLIYVKDKKDLANFRSFNVDSLIANLSSYVNSDIAPGSDTTMVVSGKDKNGENRKVRVTVSGDNYKDTEMSRLEARMVKMADDLLAKVEERRADPSLSEKEKNDLNQERERLIKERDELKRELQKKQSQIYNVKVSASTAAMSDTTQRKFKPWYNEFGIDLGFNNFHTSDPYQSSTGEMIDYDLRPFGSRYISLNWITGSVIGGKGSPFRIQSGVEFNFNNLMWDNNIRIVSVDGRPVFFKEEDLNLEKSKLAMTYLTVPLMAGVQFKNSKGKEGFRFMAGGYAGYRIGTHSKIKYTNQEGDTKKDKDKGSFGLEDYQYGVSAQIGYRNFVLFSKYNLSDVFKSDRGPQAQLISFGITI